MERRRGRDRRRDDRRRDREEVKPWTPRTDLGRAVQKGEITSVVDILNKGGVILEPEIIDALIPNLKEEVIYIGGSPGKGGGIRRTATKRTVRMHKSGRRYTLSAVVAVGDGLGIVGLGKAASKEHRTALEKATLQAKLNVIHVRKGCGSWECACGSSHSIPFRTEASCGSIRVALLPGPKGLGLVANPTVRQILSLAGIKDIWVKTSGNTGARGNLVYAVFDALNKLNGTKGDI
ncbi:MAG: 30S ribosomal protein S5 [Candidatus Aenigmarchaeota archaeon]|nr:30S ribosomal protein S5 [Candidatus Aenigmarchaeota archaeon]